MVESISSIIEQLNKSDRDVLAAIRNVQESYQLLIAQQQLEIVRLREIFNNVYMYVGDAKTSFDEMSGNHEVAHRQLIDLIDTALKGDKNGRTD